jgi:hypothetical protein
MRSDGYHGHDAHSFANVDRGCRAGGVGSTASPTRIFCEGVIFERPPSKGLEDANDYDTRRSFCTEQKTRKMNTVKKIGIPHVTC